MLSEHGIWRWYLIVREREREKEREREREGPRKRISDTYFHGLLHVEIEFLCVPQGEMSALLLILIPLLLSNEEVQVGSQ